MSLSNLQSQLTALNNPKNAGLSFASNKRHEDAVGRGLHYSVRHGQALADKSIKFKATLLQAKTRDAADIPLKVLEENSREALMELGMEELVTVLCDGQANAAHIRSTLLQLTNLLDDMADECLQVLEYMLRKYDLHSQYAAELIWTLLPYADNKELWVYFHRALQLVDLATDQSYLWLRPYVSSSENTKKIPSTLLAQHIVKNTSWLTRLVQVVQSVTTPEHHLLSWSVTLIFQGFAWLARDVKADKEAVLRTIFPCLLGSFAHPVRRYWSYVIVSSMAEHMELAPETIDLLVTKIMRGAVSGLETEADALTTVLSILIPPKRQLIVDDACYIPLIGNNDGKWLGCPLSRSAFSVLVGMETLSSVIGHLHQDRQVLVAPFVAALVTRGVNQYVDVLVDLISEKALVSLWMDRQIDLAASFSAMIVAKYMHKDNLSLTSTRRLLEAVYEVDSARCEQGIAHAIRSTDDKMIDSKQKLVDLLRGIVPIDEEAMEAETNDLSKLLPHPVTVEAPDAMDVEAMPGTGISEDITDMAERTIRQWSKSHDEELAKAAAKILLNKESLESLRLAIVLEAATRPGAEAGDVVELVESAVSILTDAEAFIAFLPGLVLLEHGDSRVRTVAMKLFFATRGRLAGQNKWSLLTEIGDRLERTKVSAKMGGRLISKLLASCLKESRQSDKLRSLLLDLCVCSAAAVVQDNVDMTPDLFSSAWLPFPLATGSYTVTSVVLDALEEVGEDCCPLLARWSGAGSIILNGMMKLRTQVLPPMSLITSLVKMMKGIKVLDPQIVISTGPGQEGRRTRSYSVGRMDGVSVIEPYPDCMRQCMLLILEKSKETACHEAVAALLVTNVMMSGSWRESVFAKFNSSERIATATSLVAYAAESSSDDASGVFATLPLDASDVCSMAKNASSAAKDIHLTYLAEFIRLNSSSLVISSRHGSDVANLLFDLLRDSSLVPNDSDDSEGIAFLQQSVLLALERVLSSSMLKTEARQSKSWSAILLPLLGVSSNKTDGIRILKKNRLRSVALSILFKLGSERPNDVMHSLDEIVTSSIQLACGVDGSYTRHFRETLAVVIPFFKMASFSKGSRLQHIFSAFVTASGRHLERQQLLLYGDFVQVLLENNAAGDVSGLLCLYLANQARLLGDKQALSDINRLVVLVLDSAPSTLQVTSLLALLNYSNEIASFLTGADPSRGVVEGEVGVSITGEDLRATATGKGDESLEVDGLLVGGIQMHCVATLGKFILDTFADCLLLNGVQHYFKKTGDAAELCLKIWQQLLEVYTACRNRSDDKIAGIVKDFLNYAVDSLDQSRGIIQNLLPVPIFLASISSIITDGRTSDVRSSALHLVADRVVGFTSSSPEAVLFVDLVPEITSLLKSDADDLSASLLEAALLALDQIAGVVKNAVSTHEDAVKHFVDALVQVTRSLSRFDDITPSDELSPEDRQLVCSLALCSGSLVRSVGASSVAVLPSLIRSLVALLKTAAAYDRPSDSDAQVLQLACIKSLTSVIENAPQFMTPHLQLLLTEQAVVSQSLRNNAHDKLDPLILAMDRLDNTLAVSVPCRILVPALCKAVGSCSTSVGVRSTMKILANALAEASSAETVVQRKAILKAIMTACDVEGDWVEKLTVIEVCEEVLLALVMKLSEIQLRRGLVLLKEWRGETDSRKFAFWSFAKVLSRALKAIFLPCLAMFLCDAVAQLRLAAEILCKDRNLRGEEHTKRRRLNETDDMLLDEDNIRCMEPLLLCLEYSLRTDARGGGAWIRADEENRYHALLSPLGSLLEARLPIDTSSQSSFSHSAYHQLVHGGTESSGSVIGCLAALAGAAGNEQLWKPLNHAVLEACANERRAEVRRAGLECLLSLMRSLGEEYMVLLPECLPVLSEALEDGTEENAALAREIVSLAEELIGESLQDSLR